MAGGRETRRLAGARFAPLGSRALGRCASVTCAGRQLRSPQLTRSHYLP